jgi:hypothetical protein
MSRSAKLTGRALNDRNSDAIAAATGHSVSPSRGIAANVARPTCWPWTAASGADRNRCIRPHRAGKETDLREGPTKPRIVPTAGTADRVSRATPNRASPIREFAAVAPLLRARSGAGW